MKKLLVLISILLIAISFTGCFSKKAGTQQTSGVPAKEKVFTYAIDQFPRSFDPTQSTSVYENVFFAQISEPLLKFDYKTMEPVAGIAKNWEIKDNGKTYIFHLRNDVKFSNGKPLTANDFKCSFEKALEPNSAVSYMLVPVLGAEDKLAGKAKETNGIKVIDDYTLEITLEKPNCNFLSVMASYLLVAIDKNEVEKQGKDFGITGISGPGPFKFLSSNKNEIILVKNNDYYGRKAYIDKVKFVKMTTDKAWEEYTKGNIDFTYAALNAKAAMNNPKYKNNIKVVPQLNTTMIALNSNKEPFKSNLKLREAVSFAINRHNFVNNVITDSSGIVANAIVPPILLGQPDGDKIVSYNAQKAKALLAEAGYPDGKGLSVLNFTYFNGIQKQLVESVKKDLEAVNIKVKLINVDDLNSPVAYKKDITDLCRIAFFPDYLDIDPYINPFFHTNGAYNLFEYSNQKADALLDKAEVNASFAERKNLFREAENVILKDYFFIPVAWDQLTVATSPRVKAYQISPLQVLPCDSVIIEDGSVK